MTRQHHISERSNLSEWKQVYYTMPLVNVRLQYILTDVYWTEKYKAVGGESEQYLELLESIRFLRRLRRKFYRDKFLH